ncbi:MAG: SDR family oxidoreductase [Deltaproteobacteria bacterium]|jgi:nucleoside-diphosphate-sugar epimerase|nr:SDR family oxidoreductase [Deltaproteobacteria bacterium]
MAHFLVTGGAGFIGSNLVEALVANGDRVRVLDDFSTGKRANLAAWADKIELIEGSIARFADVQRAVAGVDYVLHQAALPSVPKSIELPRESNETNISGTLNVLVAARDAKVKRVVYAASSSAYGDTPTLPKVETMPSIPKSPYAIQKYTGELYCRSFFEIYGLETVALRYFNIFGPRQDPTSFYSAVIPKFITTMMKGESPVIYGDGETSRDFTFITNVVQANLRACTAPKKAAGQVMNVACGERITLNDLARVIKDVLGKGGAPSYEPERAGDVKHSMADIGLAQELIGYEPTVKFAEGIRQTCAWYQAHGR